MLRRRKSLPFLDGLGAWLAVALLAIAAILLYTNLASAHESSTERTLSAAGLTGEDVVELSRDTVTGAVRYELSARTSVDAQQQQDLDPVYITTLGPPADGGQQAIVMPRSVTVSEDDPWFGPFYTLNDPDRSVSVDILNDYGFAIAINPSSGLCSLPHYIGSSFAIGYQTVARKGFYVRRCPGFEHLTSIRLSVTTYPDNAGYTVHYIRVISDSDPTPTRSARTATPTRTSTPTQTPGFTPSPTATPTATLEADAAATATATATLEADAAATATPTATATATATGMTLSVPALTAEAAESAVEVSWTAVGGAARYELWVWDRVNDWRQIGGNSLTGTNYRHSNVTAGTTYYYAIRAVNADGETSAWSAYVPATAPGGPLSVPALTAEAAGSEVEVSWTAVAGAARYELWVWDSVNGWRQIGGNTLAGTTYTHSDVTAGTTYYYQMRAVNAGAETSAWSDLVPATVPAASLSVPALTAEATESAVELSWTAVAGAARYELWVWDSVNGWRQIGGNTLTGTTYTHSDVTAGTTYYYQMRAVNGGGGTSAWSIRVSETVPAAQQ